MGTRLRVRMLPTLLIVIAIHQASWPLLGFKKSSNPPKTQDGPGKATGTGTGLIS